MSYEKKEPPHANVSLARIAWSMKELVDEIKKMNDLKDPREDPGFMKGSNPLSNGNDQNDDIPF